MKGTAFGQYLRSVRKQRSLTLNDVASLLGVSGPYISDIELGRRAAPNYGKLKQLVKVFGLTREETDTFFNLAGESRHEVAPDLVEYISQRPYVSQALRAARYLGADREDWEQAEQLFRQRREGKTARD